MQHWILFTISSPVMYSSFKRKHLFVAPCYTHAYIAPSYWLLMLTLPHLTGYSCLHCPILLVTHAYIAPSHWLFMLTLPHLTGYSCLHCPILLATHAYIAPSHWLLMLTLPHLTGYSCLHCPILLVTHAYIAPSYWLLMLTLPHLTGYSCLHCPISLVIYLPSISCSTKRSGLGGASPAYAQASAYRQPAYNPSSQEVRCPNGKL